MQFLKATNYHHKRESWPQGLVEFQVCRGGEIWPSVRDRGCADCSGCRHGQSHLEQDDHFSRCKHYGRVRRPQGLRGELQLCDIRGTSRYNSSCRLFIYSSLDQAVHAFTAIGQPPDAGGLAAATSGNHSARLADGRIAIRVSGRHKSRLSAKDVIVVDEQGAPLEDQRPLAETAPAYAAVRPLSVCQWSVTGALGC
jgi:hypothetical protein